MITVPVTVATNNVTFPVTVASGSQTISVNPNVAVYASVYPDYSGGYEFAPSNDVQIIHAADMVMHEDIIIDAIPNNYGLVTWDGSTLTVS